MDRKYSVTEIDRMRAAVVRMTGWNEYDPCPSSERPTRAEEKLRTYMLNGCSPEEIEDRAKTVIEDAMAQRRARDEARAEMQRVCDHQYTHEDRANFKECLKCHHTVIDQKPSK